MFFNNIVGDRDDGKCEVCAVGAVLRNTRKNFFQGKHAAYATNYMCDASDIESAYESGNFLSILSSEYEAAALDWNNTTNLIRFHTLMIAEGMCPSVLEFKV